MTRIEQLVSRIRELKPEPLETSIAAGKEVSDALCDSYGYSVKQEIGGKANGPGVYWFETNGTLLQYPFDVSKVYYVGKAEHLVSRLVSKIKADVDDGNKKFRSVAPSVFNYTYFNYIKAYGAKIWSVSLGKLISERTDLREIESLLFIAFLCKAGNYPFANKQGANPEIANRILASEADLAAVKSLYTYLNQKG
jgi:hypothetical protein